MDRKTEESRRMWQRFMDTGEVGAYLMYRALRLAEETDSPGK